MQPVGRNLIAYLYVSEERDGVRSPSFGDFGKAKASVLIKRSNKGASLLRKRRFPEKRRRDADDNINNKDKQ